MVELNKKVSELALENSKLKQRIAQLEQDKRNEEKIDLIGDFNATIPSTEVNLFICSYLRHVFGIFSIRVVLRTVV